MPVSMFLISSCRLNNSCCNLLTLVSASYNTNSVRFTFIKSPFLGYSAGTSACFDVSNKPSALRRIGSNGTCCSEDLSFKFFFQPLDDLINTNIFALFSNCLVQ